MEEVRCPFCGSSYILESSEYGLVCGNCGAILLDVGLESSYAQKPPGRTQENPSHVKVRHVIGNGIILDELLDQFLPPREKEEKMFFDMLSICEKMLYELGVSLSPELERSLEMCIWRVVNTIKESKIKIRSTVPALAIATLYFFLIKHGVPRTLKTLEIIAMKKLSLISSGKQLYRAVQKLRHILAEDRNIVLKPEDVIVSMSKHIDIPSLYVNIALALCKIARSEKLLMGKSPGGVASAILFLVCNMFLDNPHKKLKQEILKISGISKATLRSRVYELLENDKIRSFLCRVKVLMDEKKYDEVYELLEQVL